MLGICNFAWDADVELKLVQSGTVYRQTWGRLLMFVDSRDNKSITCTTNLSFEGAIIVKVKIQVSEWQPGGLTALTPTCSSHTASSTRYYWLSQYFYYSYCGVKALASPNTSLYLFICLSYGSFIVFAFYLCASYAAIRYCFRRRLSVCVCLSVCTKSQKLDATWQMLEVVTFDRDLWPWEPFSIISFAVHISSTVRSFKCLNLATVVLRYIFRISRSL